MSNVEREVEASYRLIHPGHFGYYDQFLQNFRDGLGIERLLIDTGSFADKSPYFRIVAGDKREFCAIIPLWLVPPFEKSLFRAQEVGSALTHEERGRPPLADRVIALIPYAELRQDKDSIDSDTGEYKEGEVIYAEIFANTLAAHGYTEAVILEPHSYEATSYFKIPYLPLTAAPLFAKWLKETSLVAPETNVVALDKGTLQRCWYLTEILGLDPKSNLVVLPVNGNKSLNTYIFFFLSHLILGSIPLILILIGFDCF